MNALMLASQNKHKKIVETLLNISNIDIYQQNNVL